MLVFQEGDFQPSFCNNERGLVMEECKESNLILTEEEGKLVSLGRVRGR